MNKINESNCEDKIKSILEKIDEIRELIDFGDDLEMTDQMKTVFNTIYTVCISNKLFSKIYANVLISLSTKYDCEINNFINEKLAEYLESMRNIVDVDSKTDYDAFCEFNVKNDLRKNITNLFCEIAKTNKYKDFGVNELIIVVSNLLNRIFESINTATKQKEIEEITETIVIIFSHFEKELKQDLKPRLEQLASFKTSETPGLTSRTKFKYMDLIGK